METPDRAENAGSISKRTPQQQAVVGQQIDQDTCQTSNEVKKETSSGSKCIGDDRFQKDLSLDSGNNSDSQEARSLSLLKRIGKIKERLSMSSLNYSQDTKERDSIRSKSMPFAMHDVSEIIDEADVPHNSRNNASIEAEETPAKSTHSLYSTRSPNITTPLNASQSFPSFSTLASDLGGDEELFSDHNSTTDQELNVSKSSHRSTISPMQANAVCPSPTLNFETEEPSEYYVDEQRANVVEKLRGAAFKRRMDVSRSRDSLLAKEQRQRAQNQVEALDPQAGISAKEDNVQKTQDQSLESNTNQFKALPLPKTTGCEGSFGLSGVPAVKKKGITKAHSPMLGRRRQHTTPVPLLKSEKKASILPPAAMDGGLAGIPRVSKKPATVPRSPMLGRRRAQSVKPVSNRRPSVPFVRRKSVESNSSASSTSLLGLAICTNKENPDPPANAPVIETPTTSKSTGIKAFVPHSTKRAAERQAYEIRRAEYEQAQRENQKRERKVLIQRLERDIEKIRLKL